MPNIEAPIFCLALLALIACSETDNPSPPLAGAQASHTAQPRSAGGDAVQPKHADSAAPASPDGASPGAATNPTSQNGDVNTPSPPDSARAAGPYLETNGYLCIGAESTRSDLGNWVRHTDTAAHDFVDGFSGAGCLQFIGNREMSGPPDSVLTYRIRITNPGVYRLAIRGLEAPMETKEGDKANDCYARMQGQPDWRGKFTKHVLLGASYKWSWNVKSEYAHHKFAIAEYNLAAGDHTFQIAGRSKNFFIDRIVLYKDLKRDKATDLKLAPSTRDRAAP